jgi:hypothetical protein
MDASSSAMVGLSPCATRARFRKAAYAIVANELVPVHRGRTLLCGADAGVHRDADECFAESVDSRKQLSVTLDPLGPDILCLIGENGEARYQRRQQP